MKRLTSLTAIAVALSLTAGCAHRRTANELPPEPPSATTAESDNVGNFSFLVRASTEPWRLVAGIVGLVHSMRMTAAFNDRNGSKAATICCPLSRGLPSEGSLASAADCWSAP